MLQLQLENGGKAPLQVTGNSMYPMLRSRKDSVLLQTVEGELHKGDLIFYRRENGAYVLHRIVKMPGGQAFICSGDNQFEPEQVKADQVIARVTEFTRKGKLYKAENAAYRLYVWLWTGLFPVRRPLLAIRKKLGDFRRKLRKKWK